ncbi:hypothetical protein BDB00DRAFT_871964 [Zychaea mexicana]|uniref:uncharacterized protein n=1 Tax=Zychaea mexicana TaxID=64656 RepID=UPI0022FE3ACC|nr:uncharacterized protein BDB00DRAFT_871964 [Zychaea mexicana]KAI9493960.1 hypothetical protein BDB00DRAFT_871964 [Zychaea mexicana]
MVFAGCRTPDLKTIKTLHNILNACDSLALDINFKAITADVVADLPLQLVFADIPTNHPVTNRRSIGLVCGLYTASHWILIPATSNLVRPTLLTGIAIDELANQLYCQTHLL